MSSLSRRAKRLLVVLALVTFGSGLGFLAPETASAKFGKTYSISYDFATRGEARCDHTRYTNPPEINCTVKDTRADRFQVFVIPQYYNGSIWKNIPGIYEWSLTGPNPYCIVTTGSGRSKTCYNVIDTSTSPFWIAWEKDPVPVAVRLRVGLINKYDKKVKKTYDTPSSTIFT